MPDPSCVCDLHHSSWQHRILNPLSEARDWARNLMVGSWLDSFPLCHNGNSHVRISLKGSCNRLLLLDSLLLPIITCIPSAWCQLTLSSGLWGIWTPMSLPNIMLCIHVSEQYDHIHLSVICTKNHSCLGFLWLGCYIFRSQGFSFLKSYFHIC